MDEEIEIERPVESVYNFPKLAVLLSLGDM